MLSKPVKVVVFGLMAVSGLLAAYSLLTYGSQDSLLRLLFHDPTTDWYVAVISSAVFFILGFIPFQARQERGFRELVEINAENIRAHRANGWTDEDIASSMLDTMNVRPGLSRETSKKKLVYYLSQYR